MVYAVTNNPIEIVDEVHCFGARYIVVAKTAGYLSKQLEIFLRAFPRDRFAFEGVAVVSGPNEEFGLFAERQQTIFTKEDIVPSTKSALKVVKAADWNAHRATHEAKDA